MITPEDKAIVDHVAKRLDLSPIAYMFYMSRSDRQSAMFMRELVRMPTATIVRKHKEALGIVSVQGRYPK